jgi:phosphoserine aminotransferase
MKPAVNYTPGPSQLYFTVTDHVRTAFREGIPSLSHRSKDFEKIYAHTTEGLRALLNIPDDFHILFAASATEIWERIIQNLVEEKSHHFINGAFSKRFFDIAAQLGRKPTHTTAPEGSGFVFAPVCPTELIAFTHNETSTGVALPLHLIYEFRKQHPETLIAIDAVSSLPFPAFDFSQLDSVFFSVQKGFGLPAGLGVWLVNNACIEKAEKLLARGKSIGSYHTLPSLVSHAKKFQTPETPNVLGIYLLSRVVEDLNRRGIQNIRNETNYKAALLYHALSNHPVCKAFVHRADDQSKTVIVADAGPHTTPLTKYLLSNGIQPGEGYGVLRDTQLRFANFPAHSKEQYEQLVDVLAAFSG